MSTRAPPNCETSKESRAGETCGVRTRHRSVSTRYVTQGVLNPYILDQETKHSTKLSVTHNTTTAIKAESVFERLVFRSRSQQ